MLLVQETHPETFFIFFYQVSFVVEPLLEPLSYVSTANPKCTCKENRCHAFVGVWHVDFAAQTK